MYDLDNCDLFLKDSASRSSEQEHITDYKFFRLNSITSFSHS